jgi:hypothetical protein
MLQFLANSSSQCKNFAKPFPTLQLRLQNSFINQMPTQSRGCGGQNGSTRRRQGRGFARPIGENTN